MNKTLSSVMTIAMAGLVGCAESDPQKIQALSEEQQADGGSCYTTDGFSGELLKIDLASGEIGPVGTTLPFTHDISSLGLANNHLLWCESFANVLALDLATNEIKQVAIDCDGVTSDGQRVYVQSMLTQSLTEFDSLEKLLGNSPTRTLPASWATRIGAGEGRLLAAWHSAPEVLSIDLATGADTAIKLEGYDGWIFGLAEVGGSIYVNGGWVEQGIRVYDAAGTLLNTLAPDRFLAGLACGAGSQPQPPPEPPHDEEGGCGGPK
jgi:hypothetical protein